MQSTHCEDCLKPEPIANIASNDRLYSSSVSSSRSEFISTQIFVGIEYLVDESNVFVLMTKPQSFTNKIKVVGSFQSKLLIKFIFVCKIMPILACVVNLVYKYYELIIKIEVL